MSLSLETVRYYRGITAEGRRYRPLGVSWDLVVLAAQHLLLYPPRPRASYQAELQRALNAAACSLPTDFYTAVRRVVIEYADPRRSGPVYARRITHAVATLEEWDREALARRVPRLPGWTLRRLAVGPEPRRPSAPRGAASPAWRTRAEAPGGPFRSRRQG